MNRNLISGGTIQAISRIDRIVSAIFIGPEIRFARSQPMAPLCDIGGGNGSCVALCTNAISAALAGFECFEVGLRPWRHRSTSAMRRLYQFMIAEVPRLMVR